MRRVCTSSDVQQQTTNRTSCADSHLPVPVRLPRAQALCTKRSAHFSYESDKRLRAHFLHTRTSTLYKKTKDARRECAKKSLRVSRVRERVLRNPVSASSPRRRQKQGNPSSSPPPLERQTPPRRAAPRRGRRRARDLPPELPPRGRALGPPGGARRRGGDARVGRHARVPK